CPPRLFALAPLVVVRMRGPPETVRAAESRSGDEPRAERALIDRLRFILAVIATMASVFVVDDLVTPGHSLGAFFAFRVAGVILPLTGFFALRRPWAHRWPRELSVGIVAFAYLFVASAGMASPTGEYATTAFLFVGAALLTATVLPWGLGPQVVTVSLGASALLGVIVRKDGSFHALATDPPALLLIGFLLPAL